MMFRNVYHQANDDIPLNEDLLNAILSGKTKKHKYLYPRFTVAAGILLVSAAVVAYPYLTNNHTKENISFTPGSVSPSESYLAVSPLTHPENTPDVSVVNTPMPNNTIISDKNPDTNNEMSNEIPDEKSKSEKHPENNIPSHENSQKYSINSPTMPPVDAQDNQNSDKLSSDSPAAEIQNIEMHTEDINISESVAQVKGVNSDLVTRSSLITETWNEENYFEYLGKKIIPSLPDDLVKVSDTEKNMTLFAETKIPYYDTWILKYSSEDGLRTVSVRISKNSSNIPDMITKDENHAEIVSSDALLNIEVFGLSAEEFTLLCSSLT